MLQLLKSLLGTARIPAIQVFIMMSGPKWDILQAYTGEQLMLTTDAHTRYFCLPVGLFFSTGRVSLVDVNQFAYLHILRLVA